MELLIDGVPLPSDATPLAHHTSKCAGTWVGTWDGWLKTILIVESVSHDGRAKVVYAVAKNPGVFERGWFRRDAKVSGATLTVHGEKSKVAFDMSPTGRLRAVFDDGLSFAVLTRHALDDLRQPNATIEWTGGESTLLVTSLQEPGTSGPLRLETVLFKPPGNGPFPLAVINHGSTGTGTDQVAAKKTWVNAWLADVLNEHGWFVAFPQRRGRGRSDGIYGEGFDPDRSKGYTCDVDRSLAGAERALDDISAAVSSLRQRSDIDRTPVLLAGQSRGGILSIAYAGRHARDTLGVVNFVGGWLGELCSSAAFVNQKLFASGRSFQGLTLWIYGRDDVYYTIESSRRNFDVYRRVGGHGRFVEVSIRGKNNGHWAIAFPPLWSESVATYLTGLKDNRP
ncbi:MAG: alpha/beta hydrolase [Pseudomonadota bacterium]